VIPLYAFVAGDTLGLLVLGDETETVAELADKLQQSARVRVRARDKVKLIYKGHVLEPSLTLAKAGLGMLERVDLVPDDG
jgi:hypothetical protein